MQLRALGRSGLMLPPITVGGNVFGWTADEATSFRLLDALVDAGLTAIDTADVYSAWVPGHAGGESETIIGSWLKKRGGRDRISILTKVGMKMGSGDEGLSPAWIARAVEDSLRRLQVDHIDLYQAHRDDPATPLEDTLSAFDRLIKAGKVRAIGASNYEAPRLKQALDTSERLGLARFESLQPLYNLLERAGFETALEALCLEREVGVINFYALGAGFLTGKYRSEADLGKSPRGARLGKYLDERGMRILAALDEVAASLNAAPGQVAIAWLIARPSVTSPIASASTLDQVHDLIDAATLTLDDDAIARLDAASGEAA